MSSLPDLRATLAHPAYRRGLREMSGVSLGIAAWGLVTGVAMVNSGLPVALALLMSFTVYAGSAQLAALPLIALGAPVWVILATGFCVNLRFVIFSAQWRPYLMRLPLKLRLLVGYVATDLNYVMFMQRYPEPPRTDEPVPEGQIEYLWGSVSASYLSWQLPSVVGIVLAGSIPTQWGLGFAGTLALLGLAYSLVSDRATLLAAVVAGCAAIAAFALPYKLNVVVAIAAAVCVGLMIDGGGDAGRRLSAGWDRVRGRRPGRPGSQARCSS